MTKIKVQSLYALNQSNVGKLKKAPSQDQMNAKRQSRVSRDASVSREVQDATLEDLRGLFLEGDELLPSSKAMGKEFSLGELSDEAGTVDTTLPELSLAYRVSTYGSVKTTRYDRDSASHVASYSGIPQDGNDLKIASALLDAVESPPWPESEDIILRLNSVLDRNTDIKALLRVPKKEAVFKEVVSYIVQAFKHSSEEEIVQPNIYRESLNNLKLTDALFTEAFLQIIKDNPNEIDTYLRFLLKNTRYFSQDFFTGSLAEVLLKNSTVSSEILVEWLEQLSLSSLIALIEKVGLSKLALRSISIKQVFIKLQKLTVEQHAEQIIHLLEDNTDTSILEETQGEEVNDLVRSLLIREERCSRDALVKIWNNAVKIDSFSIRQAFLDKIIHFILTSEDPLDELIECLSGVVSLKELSSNEKSALVDAYIKHMLKTTSSRDSVVEEMWKRAFEKKTSVNPFDEVLCATCVEKDSETFRVVNSISIAQLSGYIRQESRDVQSEDDILNNAVACEKIIVAIINAEPSISFIYFPCTQLSVEKQIGLLSLALTKLKETLIGATSQEEKLRNNTYIVELLRRGVSIGESYVMLADWINQLRSDVTSEQYTALIKSIFPTLLEKMQTIDAPSFLSFLNKLELPDANWHQLVDAFVFKGNGLRVLELLKKAESESPKITYLKQRLDRKIYEQDWKSDVSVNVDVYQLVLKRCAETPENEESLRIAKALVSRCFSAVKAETTEETTRKEELESIIKYGLFVIYNSGYENNIDVLIDLLLIDCHISGKDIFECVDAFKEIEQQVDREQTIKYDLAAKFAEQFHETLGKRDLEFDEQQYAAKVITTLPYLKKAVIEMLLDRVSKVSTDSTEESIPFVKCLKEIRHNVEELKETRARAHSSSQSWSDSSSETEKLAERASPVDEGNNNERLLSQNEQGLDESYRITLQLWAKAIVHATNKETALVNALKEFLTPAIAWDMLSDPEILLALSDFALKEKGKLGAKLVSRQSSHYDILFYVFEKAAEKPENYTQEIEQLTMNLLEYFSKDLGKIEKIFQALFTGNSLLTGGGLVKKFNKKVSVVGQISPGDLVSEIINFMEQNLLRQEEADKRETELRMSEAFGLASFNGEISPSMAQLKDRAKHVFSAWQNLMSQGEDTENYIKSQIRMALNLGDINKAAEKLALAFSAMQSSNSSPLNSPERKTKKTGQKSPHDSLKLLQSTIFSWWIQKNNDYNGVKRVFEILLHSTEKNILENTTFFKLLFQHYQQNDSTDTHFQDFIEVFKNDFFENLRVISQYPNGNVLIAFFIQNIVGNERLETHQKLLLLLNWPVPWPREKIQGKEFFPTELLKEVEVEPSIVAEEQLLLLDAFVMKKGGYENQALRYQQRDWLPSEPTLLGAMFLRLVDLSWTGVSEQSRQYLLRGILKKLNMLHEKVSPKEHGEILAEFIDNISQFAEPFHIVSNVVFNPNFFYEGVCFVAVWKRLQQSQQISLENLLYKVCPSINDHDNLSGQIADFIRSGNVVDELMKIGAFQDVIELEFLTYHDKERLAITLIKEEKIAAVLPVLGKYLPEEDLMSLYVNEVQKAEEANSVVLHQLALIIVQKKETYEYADSSFSGKKQLIVGAFKQVGYDKVVSLWKELSDEAKKEAIQLFSRISPADSADKERYLEGISALLTDYPQLISFDQLNRFYERISSIGSQYSLTSELETKIVAVLLQKQESYKESYIDIQHLKKWHEKVGIKEALNALKICLEALPIDERTIVEEQWLKISLLDEREENFLQYWGVIGDSVDRNSLPPVLENLLIRWLKDSQNIQQIKPEKLHTFLMLLSSEKCHRIWAAHYKVLEEQRAVFEWLSLPVPSVLVFSKFTASNFKSLQKLLPNHALPDGRRIAAISPDENDYKKLTFSREQVELLKDALVQLDDLSYIQEALRLKELLTNTTDEDEINFRRFYIGHLITSQSPQFDLISPETVKKHIDERTLQNVDFECMEDPTSVVEELQQERKKLESTIVRQVSVLDKLKGAFSHDVQFSLLVEEGKERILSQDEFDRLKTEKPPRKHLLAYYKKWAEYQKQYDKIKKLFDDFLSSNCNIQQFEKALAQNFGSLDKLKSIAEAAGAYDFAGWLTRYLKVGKVDSVASIVQTYQEEHKEQVEDFFDPEDFENLIINARVLRLTNDFASQLAPYLAHSFESPNDLYLYQALFLCPDSIKSSAQEREAGLRNIKNLSEILADRERNSKNIKRVSSFNIRQLRADIQGLELILSSETDEMDQASLSECKEKLEQCRKELAEFEQIKKEKAALDSRLYNVPSTAEQEQQELAQIQQKLDQDKAILLEHLAFLASNLSTFPDMDDQKYAEILNSYGDVVFGTYYDDTTVLNDFLRVLIAIASPNNIFQKERLALYLSLLKPVSSVQGELDPKKLLFILAVGGVNSDIPALGMDESNVTKVMLLEERRENCQKLLEAAIQLSTPRVEEESEQLARADFRKLVFQYLKKDAILKKESALLREYLEDLKKAGTDDIRSSVELMDNVKNQAVLRETLSDPEIIATLGDQTEQAVTVLEGANKLYRLHLTSQLVFDVKWYEEIIAFKQKIAKLILKGEYQEAKELAELSKITEKTGLQLLNSQLQTCLTQFNPPDFIASEEEWNQALEFEQESIAFLQGRKTRLEQFSADVLVRALQRQFYETCAYEEAHVGSHKGSLSEETINKARENYAAYMKKRLEDYRQGFLRDKISMLAEYIGGKKGNVEKEKSVWLQFWAKHQRSFESTELVRKVGNHSVGIGASIFVKNAEGKLIKIAELGDGNQLIVTDEHLRNRVALQKAIKEYKAYKEQCEKEGETFSEEQIARLQELSSNFSKANKEWIASESRGLAVDDEAKLYSNTGQCIGIYCEDECSLSQFIYAVDSHGVRVEIGKLGKNNRLIFTDDRLLKQERVARALKAYYDYESLCSSGLEERTPDQKSTLLSLEKEISSAKESLELSFKTKGGLVLQGGTRLFISNLQGGLEDQGYYDETDEDQVPIWRQDNAFCRSQDILCHFDVEEDEDIQLRVVPALVQDVLSEGGLSDFYHHHLASKEKKPKTTQFLKQVFLERLKLRYFYLTDADLSCLVEHHTFDDLVGLLKSLSKRESSSLAQAAVLLQKMLLNHEHCAEFAKDAASRAALFQLLGQLHITNEQAKEWMELAYPNAEGNAYIPDLLITYRVVHYAQDKNEELLQQWNIENLPDAVIQNIPAAIKVKWFRKTEYLPFIQKNGEVAKAVFANIEDRKRVISDFLNEQLSKVYFVTGLVLFDQTVNPSELVTCLEKSYIVSPAASLERQNAVLKNRLFFLKVFCESPELHTARFANIRSFSSLFTNKDELMEAIRYHLRHRLLTFYPGDNLRNVLKQVLQEKARSALITIQAEDVPDLIQFISELEVDEQRPLGSLFSEALLIEAINQGNNSPSVQIAIYHLFNQKFNDRHFCVQENNFETVLRFIDALDPSLGLNTEGLKQKLYDHTRVSLEKVYDAGGNVIHDRRLAETFVSRVLASDWSWSSSTDFKKWQAFFACYVGQLSGEKKAQEQKRIVHATVEAITPEFLSQNKGLFWENVLSEGNNADWSVAQLQDNHFEQESFFALTRTKIGKLAQRGQYDAALVLYKKIPESRREAAIDPQMIKDIEFERGLAHDVKAYPGLLSKNAEGARKKAFAHYFPAKGLGLWKWCCLAFGWWKNYSDGRLISSHGVAVAAGTEPATLSSSSGIDIEVQSPIHASVAIEAEVEPLIAQVVPDTSLGEVVAIARPVPEIARAIPPKRLKKDVASMIQLLQEKLAQYKQDLPQAFSDEPTENIMHTLSAQIGEMRKLVIDICRVLPSENENLAAFLGCIGEIESFATKEPYQLQDETLKRLEPNFTKSSDSSGNYSVLENKLQSNWLSNQWKVLLRTMHKKLVDNRAIIAPRVSLFDSLRSFPATEPRGQDNKKYVQMIGGLQEALSSLHEFKEAIRDKKSFNWTILSESLQKRITDQKLPEGFNAILKKILEYQEALKNLEEVEKTGENSENINNIKQQLGLNFWRAIVAYYLKNIVESCYEQADKKEIYDYLRSELSRLMKKFESLNEELLVIQSDVLLHEIMDTTAVTLEEALNVSEDSTMKEYQRRTKELASILEDDTIHCLRYVEACNQLRAGLPKSADERVVKELNRRVLEAENLAEEAPTPTKQVETEGESYLYQLPVHQDNYIHSARARGQVICAEARKQCQNGYKGVPDALVSESITRAASKERKLELIRREAAKRQEQANHGQEMDTSEMLKDLELEGLPESRQESRATIKDIAASQNPTVVVKQERSVDDVAELEREKLEKELFEAFKEQERASLENLKVEGNEFESPYSALVLGLLDSMKENAEHLFSWNLSPQDKEFVGKCQLNDSLKAFTTFASFRDPLALLKSRKKQCLKQIKHQEEEKQKPSEELLTEYALLSVRLALLGQVTENYGVVFVNTEQEAKNKENLVNTFYCFPEEGQWRYVIKADGLEVIGRINNLDKGKQSSRDEVIQKIEASATQYEGCTCIGLELANVTSVLRTYDYKFADSVRFLETLSNGNKDLQEIYKIGQEGLSQDSFIGIEGKIDILGIRIRMNKSVLGVYSKILDQLPEDKRLADKKQELLDDLQAIRQRLLEWKKSLEDGSLSVESFNIQLFSDSQGLSLDSLKEKTIYLCQDENNDIWYFIPVRNEEGELIPDEYKRLSGKITEETQGKIRECFSKEGAGEHVRKLLPSLNSQDKTDILRVAISNKDKVPRDTALLSEFIDKQVRFIESALSIETRGESMRLGFARAGHFGSRIAKGSQGGFSITPIAYGYKTQYI